MVPQSSDILKKSGKKGVTLVELLVVIAIIATLTLIVVPNYRSWGKQLSLQRSSNKLSQDIRSAEEMALSAQQCTACSGVPQGYGVYLVAGASSYLIYADTYPASPNSNQSYDSGQDIVTETVSLESGVIIQSVSPSPLSVNFKSPDPIVKISNGGVGANEATIVLQLQGDASKTKTIKVNMAGLIYVQ